MKRFQVEKTQSGYLAKKRKRPITQQYYDQGVPRNVLMPPRTLLAQNILDSHGSSFFDTFSYLNFMKDYFRQNQMTTPSFTDPNSLWGKITKWHQDKKREKAEEEEKEKKIDAMSPEEIHERLQEVNKKIDELDKDGNPNKKDTEKLIKEQQMLERRDIVVDVDNGKELPTSLKLLVESGVTREKDAIKRFEEAKKKEEEEKAKKQPGWFQTMFPFLGNESTQPDEVMSATSQTQTDKAQTPLPQQNETEKEIPFPTLGEDKQQNYAAVISFLLSSPSLSKTWNELGRPRLIHRLSQGNKPEFISIREHPGEITVISFADLLDPNRKADEKRLIYFNINDKDPLNKEAETSLRDNLQEMGLPQHTIDTVMYTRKGVGENIARFNASRK